LWDDQVKHDTYDDYWKARNLAPHLKNIQCAVLTVGGWFDAEDLQGPFSVYDAVGRYNPGTFNAIVVGPWVHGGWARYQGHSLGSVDFESDTSRFFNREILFPFFEQYLKGGPDAKLPQAYVFETGTNVWRRYAKWPPKESEKKTLYFRANGGLSFDPPTESADAHDEYVSDPAHPVPFVNYPQDSVPQEYMLSDQRFASTRSDVLVYETEPLEEDVTVVGPTSPRLFVSTTGTDSDFVVKLIDVYPPDFPGAKSSRNPNEPSPSDVGPPEPVLGGYEQLVRGEPFRGKFRKSFEKPEPFTPEKVEEINFTMPDINHTFRRGHRIMVQVQSSWFPLVDRNPQVFINIPDAKPSDFQKATERIYRDAKHSSGIEMQLLP
jgi:putative CocE/NonD family hydrolase